MSKLGLVAQPIRVPSRGELRSRGRRNRLPHLLYV